MTILPVLSLINLRQYPKSDPVYVNEVLVIKGIEKHMFLTVYPLGINIPLSRQICRKCLGCPVFAMKCILLLIILTWLFYSCVTKKEK